MQNALVGMSNGRLDLELRFFFCRSIARSLARSIARIIWGVRISNYGYSGELFGGSNFDSLACIIFIWLVSEFRITFQKNYDRTFLLFQGVSLAVAIPSERSSDRSIERLRDQATDRPRDPAIKQLNK